MLQMDEISMQLPPCAQIYVTCSMCPVSVRRRVPLAVSQILMVRSPLPVANHSFPGSNAMERTHLQEVVQLGWVSIQRREL